MELEKCAGCQLNCTDLCWKEKILRIDEFVACEDTPLSTYLVPVLEMQWEQPTQETTFEYYKRLKGVVKI